jgi:hypothetical protein
MSATPSTVIAQLVDPCEHLPARVLRAVIAGGSIGGLCAGLALGHSGAGVEIFERRPGLLKRAWCWHRSAG